ncbi:hypothetical protein [Georgenia sp. SYP-B2076]|uniref:hypothetical protein n=1 Tax=Georgenia sp. SYP-B2076 TaxID=2495881 RepID=UPI000F8D850E|nr:hypothetical protein [Georgenia sp. SYP-B2076]
MHTTSDAAPDPMVGHRTLGRLLLVGTVAGGAIGGFVGGAALWSPGAPDYWDAGVSVGIGVGALLGLITQAVTLALVLGVRRVRPFASGTPGLVVAAVVPLVAVAASSVWMAGVTHGSAWRSVVIVGGAVTLAAVAVGLASRWSLSPLQQTPRPRPGS